MLIAEDNYRMVMILFITIIVIIIMLFDSLQLSGVLLGNVYCLSNSP